MKLLAESGLWTVGAQVAAPPAVAVLEVAGAVLAWTVDDPAAAVQLTFTDVVAADWLWRITGERGHVAVVEALRGRAADPQASVDIADLELSPQVLAPLRRLALGHWLRRWWPASVRDGIADLDIAVLDAELAVLTGAAQEFFGEDTLDSDIDALLRPHRDALFAHLRDGDPRVAALVESCLELAEWSESAEHQGVSADGRRDDYALAAGGPTSHAEAIGAGSVSISWSAVPPAVFDAAEDTVDWWVRGDGSGGAVARCVPRSAHRQPGCRYGCAAVTSSPAAYSTIAVPRRSPYRSRNRPPGTVIGVPPRWSSALRDRTQRTERPGTGCAPSCGRGWRYRRRTRSWRRSSPPNPITDSAAGRPPAPPTVPGWVAAMR